MTTSEQIKAWFNDLESPDFDANESAKAHLIAQGNAIVDDLIRAMTSENRRASWLAATILAQIDDPRRFNPMVHALKSNNPLLGQTAAKTLIAYGERAVLPLIDALRCSEYMTRLEVVVALERIGDLRAVPVLLEALHDAESPVMRYTIIQALGILGDDSVIPAIERYSDDPDAHVRKRVEVALARLRKSALRTHLDNKP